MLKCCSIQPETTVNFSLSWLQTSDQSSVQDVPTLSQEPGAVVADPPVMPPQADHAPTHTATAYSHRDQSQLPPADRGGAYDNPAFTAANADWPPVFLRVFGQFYNKLADKVHFFCTQLCIFFFWKKHFIYKPSLMTLFNDVLTSLKGFFGSAFE